MELAEPVIPVIKQKEMKNKKQENTFVRSITRKKICYKHQFTNGVQKEPRKTKTFILEVKRNESLYFPDTCFFDRHVRL
jgi:hypothetical protein